VPTGVRIPRQIAPSWVNRNVGSAGPRRWWTSTWPTGHGQSGRHSRVRGADTVVLTEAEYVGAG